MPWFGYDRVREVSEQHSSLLSTELKALMQSVRDTVPADLPTREFLRRLPLNRNEVLVVAREQNVLGVIVTQLVSPLDIQTVPADQHVSELVISTGTLRESDSVALALVHFMRHEAPATPVVDKSDTLVGLLWRSDLMGFCARDMLRDYQQLSVGKPSCGEQPLSHDVGAMPIPASMVGANLSELNLGKHFGVVCVGLRRTTEKGTFVAIHISPSVTLRADDVMIVTGNASDIERLAQLGGGSPNLQSVGC